MPKPIRDDALEPAPQGEAVAFRWRRHPALLKARPESPMPEQERLARLAAVRGVLSARGGDLEAAAAHFLLAAREPSIRFQVVPGFWGCSRGAMNTAVAAYEAAGRFRDAAALAATIRTRYRPRMVSPTERHASVSPLGRAISNDDTASGTGD